MGKLNKRIFILHKFDLDFHSAKYKNSLFFVEIISEFPIEENVVVEDDSFPDEHIFLISSSHPWYEDILIYIQTLKCLHPYRGKINVNYV